MTNLAVAQEWWEMERGWGGRPDGWTLHKTPADRDKFVKRYWSGMPDSAPDDYSKPQGQPKPVVVTDEEYAELEDYDLGMYMPPKWKPREENG